MNKLIPVFFLLFFTGCTELQLLPYLDQALMLKSFGEEKEAQHKFVKNSNAKFDALLNAVNTKDMSAYKTKEDIMRAFGEPVLKSTTADGMERWLYRHNIPLRAKKKVYLYFSADKLTTYEQAENDLCFLPDK